MHCPASGRAWEFDESIQTRSTDSQGAVHKVCHAIFDDILTPSPLPRHKLSQIFDPLNVCHTSEQKVNKQISRMETALK